MRELLLSVVSVCGVNLMLWSVVGLARLAGETFGARSRAGEPIPPGRIRLDEVAVVIPAHNEQLVIAETVVAVSRLVPVENVYVVSDGSRDETAPTAWARGAQVLVIPGGRGKAGALKTAFEMFDLLDRYRAILLLDADTRLDDRYFDEALPLLDDPDVVAVAGCASTIWEPRRTSFVGNVLAAHRERIYFAFQRFMKYGQGWRHANVIPIVPGFASLYRTAVLDKIRIDAPGLVIEDFNMTFDLHHLKLGRVAFTPRALAYTQDPHRLGDYHRQVKRWTLGFWQTVRTHGVWLGRFWISLALFIVEVLSSALALFGAALWVLVVLTSALIETVLGGSGVLGDLAAVFGAHLGYSTLLLGIVVPDYVMTCIAAWCQRRPSYLVYGLAFLPLRLLDSVAVVSSFFRAFRVQSSGRWVSPERQVPVRVAAPVPVSAPALAGASTGTAE